MLNQFTINLNKASSEEKQKKGVERRFRTSLGYSLGVILCSTVVLLFAVNILNAREKKQRELISGMDKRIKELQEATKGISKDDVMELYELERKRLLWKDKLVSLGNIISPDVVLTNINYRNENFIITGLIKIRKNRKEFDILAVFIDKIKADPMFSDLLDTEFKFSRRVKIGDVSFLEFQVLCLVK